MPGIGEWHIVSLLSEDFLKRLSWIYVFGNSGNEVLLLTNDDQVYVLGANTNCCLGMSKSSQVGLEPKPLEKLFGKNIISVSSGSGPHVVALSSTGDVYSWGHNGYGQLGHGDTSIHTRTPTIVSSPVLSKPGVDQVACGAYHTMALTRDGQVYTWGFNNCGQLGHGDLTSRYIPTRVLGLLDGESIKIISCSYSSSYALSQDGKVFSWGQNGSGQLGIGTNTQSMEPSLVFSLQNAHIKQIASGYSHVLAISDSGVLYTWGGNTHGQLGNGTRINQSLPVPVGKHIGKFVEIGASNSCHISAAECSNGKILMWGECCHQNIVTPLETEVQRVDEVFPRFASPGCSWRPYTVSPSTANGTTVSQCIENRFNDLDTSDLTFIVQGQHIYVHKVILKMRCSYFYSMLKVGSWSEGQMESVELNNHSYSAFYSFIKYLYTDRIDSISEEDISELLELADLYCEFNLKEMCSRLLCRRMNDENVLSLYALSLQYKLKELEESAFSYVLKHSCAVVQSETFIGIDGTFAKQFVVKLAENGAFKN